MAEQTAASFRCGTPSGQATIGTSGFGTVTLKDAAGGDDNKRRTGTFVSGVLDAQAMVDWDRVIVRADVPTGSKLTVRIRTGSTVTPEGSWSSWRPVADGDIAGKSSRYLQYRVELSSDAGSAAPALYGIGFVNNAAPLNAPNRLTNSALDPACPKGLVHGERPTRGTGGRQRFE